MTSVPKVYQNYRFDELLSFSKNNPYRTRILSPIEISTTDKEDTALDAFGLQGYTVRDIQPTGLLSMMVCLDDPHAYSLSTPAIRSQQTMEMCTALQEKTEELRNGPMARKRKKVYEWLGAIFNEARLEEKDRMELFHAMEYLKDAHFILIRTNVQQGAETDEKGGCSKEEKKETGTGTGTDIPSPGTISFSSSPLLWKQDRPLWMVDFHCRWVALPTDTDIPLRDELYAWLQTMEQKGWVIEWPEHTGTKTEMVEQLSHLPGWQDTDKKLSKEVLSRRLGKESVLHWARSVSHLNT